LKAVDFKAAHKCVLIEGNLDIASASKLVHTDKHRIMQVLSNLLLNAIRFSPNHSRIKLSVRHISALVDQSKLHPKLATCFNTQDELLEVSIQDQGSGIGKNDIKRLFDYNGLIKSKRAGLSGIGLGLCICRQVICALGGDIICQSRRDGLGSNFTFAIKLNQIPIQDEEILSQHDIPFTNI